MIVDTSAVLAILRAEPDARRFAAALARATESAMSVANYVEAGAVVDSARSPVASRRLDELLQASRLRLEPVTEQQARLARQAYRDFGKGSGHRAHLNFGDCFAYALAVDRGEPLLFKGDDFPHTDVHPVAL